MRSLLLPAVAIALMSLLTGCSSLFSSVKKCDLRTLESLGGIAMGHPYLDSHGHTILPILCDVSGTREITTQPTRLESALVCLPPEVLRKEQTVWLTLKTRRAKKGLSSRCPDVDLGKLPPETYLIYYRDPDGSEHPIGVALTKNLRPL